MLRKIKTFIALTLALVMCLGLSTTAFAAETNDSGIPENATRHEIQITLAPEESLEGNIVNGGAQTYAWGNPSMNLIYHHTATTSSFYISERYFAYEMNAIPLSGVATNQTYTIALKASGAGNITSMYAAADGVTHKLDWIDLNNDAYYYFEVTNNTDYILVIDIIYYSWN
jgi:hypothetical protein